MTTIDARGLACPEPVVLTQRAVLAQPEGVTVLVDNMASVENIGRFARARQYRVDLAQDGQDYVLTLTRA